MGGGVLNIIFYARDFDGSVEARMRTILQLSTWILGFVRGVFGLFRCYRAICMVNEDVGIGTCSRKRNEDSKGVSLCVSALATTKGIALFFCCDWWKSSASPLDPFGIPGRL